MSSRTGTVARGREARLNLVLSFLRRSWLIYLLVLPAVIYRIGITFVPLIQTFTLSLTNRNLVARTNDFVGLANYKSLLTDDQFIWALTFTFIYAVSTVMGELLIGMAVALLLHQRFVGRQAARTALLVPWAISAVLAGIMWKIMFWDVGGPINDILLRLHIIGQPLAWLAMPNYAQFAVIFASVWKFMPFAALLLLASLQTIPDELFDAAKVDGATAWNRFRHITMPLVSPVITVIIMFRLMEALRAFDQIYSLTGGGPGVATDVLSRYAYSVMFYYSKYGYGATLAVLMFMLTICTSGMLGVFLYRRARIW